MEGSRPRSKKLIGKNSVTAFLSFSCLSGNLTLIIIIFFPLYSLIQATLGSLTIAEFSLSQDVTVSSVHKLTF